MLRKLVRKGELLVCPGVYDGISLRIAQKVGFDAHYMTGYGTVASHLGLPDAGLAGYGEMVDRVRTLSRISTAPLICDGDTGYGGLFLHAHARTHTHTHTHTLTHTHTQEFPKKCGHTPGRRAVPLPCSQLRAALRRAEAFASAGALVVARTSSLSSLPRRRSRRAVCFFFVGADILFVEAPETEAEMERVGEALAGVPPLRLPLLVNVVEGGKTPVLSRQRYVELGYQVAIFPATAFLAAGRGIESVYSHLKATGSSAGAEGELADFMDFSRTLGFERVWEFDRAHADVGER
ncbi:Carboxyvinyl-carboxyphosphonate phosphorylmutase [Emiliania huxleyi CCMP1516]|uniref:Carboxyvinyl-carboxyphosphonate phosphorylmutase n=2 Tax=Emiliania huxleyi TaxID=2903 RepID=A0A0D3JRW5_EMIH1|nr:Carboxyvinyl-carboxyphosphonate phosphorylmutase [Emiliania huxleyi CCMP1516]EOD26250.1 Carboxyvinyl-carboxyphosphonate phosphorylmutase [Emiliania huxleyi CCMP1516]|eukprot:XP_005778679.1 Carboxyvinyl-carboxyphosphonate phosphorylmutase [Emiliania huxleyi CCMP1516]